MRKTIKLPAPQLSQLQEVDIDLDMTGRHYALLATSEGAIPEDVALSILKDLMEQDANKLTISELRYLFMLVKINSLENNYTVELKCTHDGKDGKPCGHINTLKFHLSDADLNRTPLKYKVPEIEFTIDKTTKTYKVMPPTMNMESALINYFLNDLGVKYEDISEDKTVAMKFTFIRSVMHLVDDKGQFIINNVEQFKIIDSYLDVNKYQTVTDLYAKCEEVDGFGVQDKIYEMRCKECGGRLAYQLPLLHGLVS